VKLYHLFICHTCPEGRKVNKGPDRLPFETKSKRDEYMKIHLHYYPDHKVETGEEQK